MFGANPDAARSFAVHLPVRGGRGRQRRRGAISQLDPRRQRAADFLSVMNPLPATGGADAQTLQSVQRLAPQAFRARAAPRGAARPTMPTPPQTLPWVKRAGTAFRWTGSWLTTFTTPEPVATEQIRDRRPRTQLIDLLNRYRMAGTESYVPDPQYVSIDLIDRALRAGRRLRRAGEAGGDRSAVARRPERGQGLLRASAGSYSANRCERSTLEAAIQAVPGVAGVTCIHYRLRDLPPASAEMGDIVPVGVSQIIRCDNDPSRPNNGALAMVVRGGR